MFRSRTGAEGGYPPGAGRSVSAGVHLLGVAVQAVAKNNSVDLRLCSLSTDVSPQVGSVQFVNPNSQHAAYVQGDSGPDDPPAKPVLRGEDRSKVSYTFRSPPCTCLRTWFRWRPPQVNRPRASTGKPIGKDQIH